MFSVFFLFFVLGIVWIFMGLRARPQTYYRHLPTGLEEKIRSACKNEGKSGAWDSRRSHGSRRTAAVGPKTLNGFRTTTAGGHRGVYKYDVCGLRFRRTKSRGVAAGRKSITRRGVKRPPRSCCGLARGEKQVDFEFTATNPARCTAFRGKLRIPRGRARLRTFSALAGRSASLEVSDDPISSPIARHAFNVFAVAHTPPPAGKTSRRVCAVLLGGTDDGLAERAGSGERSEYSGTGASRVFPNTWRIRTRTRMKRYETNGRRSPDGISSKNLVVQLHATPIRPVLFFFKTRPRRSLREIPQKRDC